MNADQRTEVMLAVLDGSATAAQHVAFETLLATDPSARGEFDGWRRMFDVLAQVPAVDPPEGMAAAIAAAIPHPDDVARGEIARPGQPFSSRSVIEAGQARTWGLPDRLRTTFRRLGRPSSTEELENMKLNRKVWVGGGMAAVALGVALFVLGFPPSSENVIGTIVPAERYRAPQATGADIKVGEPTSAQPGSSLAGTATDATALGSAAMDKRVRSDDASMDKRVRSDDASMDKRVRSDDASMDKRVRSDDASMDKRVRSDDASMDKRVRSDDASMDKRVRSDDASMDKRVRSDDASMDKRVRSDDASMDKRIQSDAVAR